MDDGSERGDNREGPIRGRAAGETSTTGHRDRTSNRASGTSSRTATAQLSGSCVCMAPARDTTRLRTGGGASASRRAMETNSIPPQARHARWCWAERSTSWRMSRRKGEHARKRRSTAALCAGATAAPFSAAARAACHRSPSAVAARATTCQRWASASFSSRSAPCGTGQWRGLSAGLGPETQARSLLAPSLRSGAATALQHKCCARVRGLGQVGRRRREHRPRHEGAVSKQTRAPISPCHKPSLLLTSWLASRTLSTPLLPLRAWLRAAAAVTEPFMSRSCAGGAVRKPRSASAARPTSRCVSGRAHAWAARTPSPPHRESSSRVAGSHRSRHVWVAQAREDGPSGRRSGRPRQQVCVCACVCR